MDLHELELHDACLIGVNLDPVARSAEVRLSYYPSGQSHERVLGTLRFAGVSQFNQLSDLEQMEKHAVAGNISYWVTGESPGVSHIYLVRGLIAVTAASVEFTTSA